MEEKEKTIEEVVPTPTNRDRFNTYMSERYKGYNPDDEEAAYGMLMDDLGARDSEKQKLVDAINTDPRIAQLLSDIVSGKRSAAGSLARHFGKDFLAAEEGTPEYDDIMKAEEERKAEAEAMAENERVYKQNIDQSVPVIESFCAANGLNVDEFLNSVWERMVSPIMQGMYTEELLTMLNNALNYDKDVEDAMKAGEVKGRNTNIAKMRSDKVGDGMPSGMTSVEQPSQKKRPRQKSIVDMALEA